MFHHTPPTVIYTLSLHDALPICLYETNVRVPLLVRVPESCSCSSSNSESRTSGFEHEHEHEHDSGPVRGDRKSTRLNSSHTVISYAVFCLKKKKKEKEISDTSSN